MGLARRLRLPRDWLKDEADAGRLPCLRVGKRRLFNLDAVKAVLCHRALTAGLKGDTALIDFLLAESKGPGHERH